MHRTLAMVMAAALVACSGSSATIGDTGPDGGTPPDSGTSDGSSPPDGSPDGGGACPSDQPAQGAPCASAELSCEYGGTGPELLCSTTARCSANASGSLAWFVTTPGKECVASQAQNPPACPSTFTGLANGAACPDPSAYTHCVYPEGMCGCLSCMGDAGALGKEWQCEAYPQPQGCPEPRPRIGSACTQENQSCGYGSLCSAVTGIPMLRCENGVWHVEPVAASCAIHICGK
jgi:hypothetical protein